MEERAELGRRRDLRDSGLTYGRQRRLVERGGWTEPVPGVLASGDGDVRLIAHAALVRAGPDAALAAGSAAEAWLGRELTCPVVVLVPFGVTIPGGSVATYRQSRIPFEVVELEGLAVTLPDRTAADVCADPSLRESDRRALVTGLVQRGRVTAAAVAAAASLTPTRVRGQVRRLVEEVLAGAESGPEAMLWREIVSGRLLPVPVLGHPLPVGRYRLDGYVPALRAGYEVQSRAHHAGTWLQDTARMAEILVECGIVLLPLVVSDIEHHTDRTLARLEGFLRNRAHELAVPLPPHVPPPQWRVSPPGRR